MLEDHIESMRTGAHRLREKLRLENLIPCVHHIQLHDDNQHEDKDNWARRALSIIGLKRGHSKAALILRSLDHSDAHALCVMPARAACLQVGRHSWHESSMSCSVQLHLSVSASWEGGQL